MKISIKAKINMTKLHCRLINKSIFAKIGRVITIIKQEYIYGGIEWSIIDW